MLRRFKFLSLSSSFSRLINSSSIIEEIEYAENEPSSTTNRKTQSTFYSFADVPDFETMPSVPKADAFAKPRLVNYLNRYAQPPTSFSCIPILVQEEQPSTQKSDPTSSWFRCETKVPIFFPGEKQPDRVATAVGFGKTEKEAENACAMHAERILDAAGAELFALGTMQARHAEAALKDGRWARFPKNHPKRGEQENEAHERRNSKQDPPPLICALGPEEKSPFLKSYNNNSSGIASSSNQPSSSTLAVKQTSTSTANDSSSSINKTTIVPASGTTNSSTATPQNLAASFSRSLFLNDKTRINDPGDIIEITLEDTKDTDDSETQHEGIEIDQAEVADWRVFPKVSQNKKVPGSFRHLDESEGGKYWLVEFGMYYVSEPHSILSPHLFCADSLERVRNYFKHHGKDFNTAVTINKVCFTPWAGQRTTLIKMTIEVPGVLLNPAHSELIYEAAAISKDHERCLHLLAMHAELMIDHLGLLLFSDEPETQKLHAEFCASMGRWAAEEEGELPPPNRSKLPPPMPLREWGDSVAIHLSKESEERRGSKHLARRVGRGTLQANRVAPLSEEEFYMHCHHCLIAPNRGHTIEGNPFRKIEDKKDELEDYVEILRQFNISQDMQRESFYLNLDYSGVYRCTTLLPLDIKIYGLRCGYSVGDTPELAKKLAARHAVEVLTHFGFPAFPNDMEKQKRFDDRRIREGRFVLDRDYSTGRLLQTPPSPNSRSPPSLRLAGTLRPLVCHDDWRAAQMIDAKIFSVVDVSADNFDRDLITAFENYCKNVFDEEHEMKLWSVGNNKNRVLPSPSTAKTPNGVCHISFYWGLQPVQERFAVQSNNAFAAVPLPRGGHPSRDALGGAASVLCVGRSNDQKGAAKCFYIHALRVLDALGLLEEYCLSDHAKDKAFFQETSFTSGNAAVLDSTKKNSTKKEEQPTKLGSEKLRMALVKNYAQTVPLDRRGAASSSSSSSSSENSSSAAATIQSTTLSSSIIPEFAWGLPPSAKCAPLRLFDDNGRPITISPEQKKNQGLVIQHLPVPVMSTVVASMCSQRATSKKWTRNDPQFVNESVKF